MEENLTRKQKRAIPLTLLHHAGGGPMLKCKHLEWRPLRGDIPGRAAHEQCRSPERRYPVSCTHIQ